MTETTLSEQKPAAFDWNLWLLWVGATLGGYLLGWLFNLPLSVMMGLGTGLVYEAGWDVGTFTSITFAFGLIIGAATGGVAAGGLQWKILRPHLALPLGPWLLATATGWTLPALVSAGSSLLLGSHQMGAMMTGMMISLLTTAMTGVLVGLLQWLVLRPYLAQAGWWILANLSGYLFCAPFGLGAVLLSAMITGLTLQWLLVKPRPLPQDPATPVWLEAVRQGQPRPALLKQSSFWATVPDVGQMGHIWLNALWRPRLAFFQAEKGRANLTTALWWMVIVGLVTGLVTGLYSIVFYLFAWKTLLSPVFEQPTLPEVQSLFQGFMIFGTVLNTLAPLITAPLSLFIVSGILFLLTKLFQGDGSFEEHTYLIATVYAPLYLISQTVGLIPFLGWLVMVGLFFYQLLPGRYAIQAAHPRLNSRQALYVVLIPIGAITALFGLFFLVWFMLFFGVQFLRS